MDQSEKVIQMLENANNGRIDYRNRLWLNQNVPKLNIRVSDFEDDPIIVNTYDIGEAWEEKESIFIQSGERVTLKTSFDPEKEALLLRKSLLRGYYVYLFPEK